MSNPRYARQIRRYTCAPIALLNTLKWAGYRCDRKSYIENLIERTRCISTGDETGTFKSDMYEALQNTPEFSRVSEVIRPTLKTIDNQLDSGGAVILSIDGKNYGHTFLCAGRTKKNYIVVNLYFKETINNIRRKTMSKYLRGNFDGFGSYCWLISKEG